MVDKMMRVAVRGKDGKAKALSSNNEGELITTISESLLLDKQNSVAFDFSKKKQGDESGIVIRTTRNINAYDKPFRGGSELSNSSYGRLGKNLNNISLNNGENESRYLHYFVEINLLQYLKYLNKLPKGFTDEQLNERVNSISITLRTGGVDRIARYSMNEESDYVNFGQSDNNLIDEFELKLNNPTLGGTLYLNIRSVDNNTYNRSLTLEYISIDVNYMTPYLPTGVEGGGGDSYVDVGTGNVVNGLSIEKDPDDYNVLRVVDAAPFAYDRDVDKLRVSNDKRVKKELISESFVAEKNGGHSFFVSPSTRKNATLKFLTVYVDDFPSNDFEVRYQVGGITGYPHEYFYIDKVESGRYEVNSNDDNYSIFKNLVFSDEFPLTIRIVNKTNNDLSANARISALFVEEGQ